MEDKLAFLFIGVCCLISSCTNQVKEKNNGDESTSLVGIQIMCNKGRKIVRSNCSGCHSLATDSLYSHVTLYDMYNADSVMLLNKIYSLVSDSIHKNRILINDSIDAESTVIYIKQLYDVKP